MSLINDALKRASQQAKKSNPSQPFAPQDGGAPMTPVSGGVDPTEKHRRHTYLLIAILAFCVIAPTWLLMEWRSGHKKEETKVAQAPVKPAAPVHQITVTTNIVARPVTPPPKTNAPAVKPTQPAEVQGGTINSNLMAVASNLMANMKGSTNADASKPDEQAKPKVAKTLDVETPAPPTHPSWPALKLQGIVYRLRSPSVLLNGQTARLGDVIDGVTIVEINRMDVKVEFNGETNTLLMP